MLLAVMLSDANRTVFAQSGSSTTDSRARSPARVGQQDVGQRGGQSLADFTELIALIRTTIPGQWDTGEDTITSYVNGVWIDPAGKLHREPTIAKNQSRKPVVNGEGTSATGTRPESDFISIPMLDELGLDREESVRWISIRQIEKLLLDREKDKSRSVCLELLGGLTRLDHVARDHETNDWYLGGPAGGMVLDKSGNLISRTTGLPPILLEDLLCVAPLVLKGKGPLGCSIDPVPESLKKVSMLIRQNSFIKQLSSQPEKATNFLSDSLGDQRATFIGLPYNSPTAMALLLADEHMKRIGLGLVDERVGAPKGVVNYWQACEKLGAVPGQSMVRWWFTMPNQVSIGVDESGDVFTIQSSSVRVMSQKQFLDQRGDRQDSADKDLAADTFADSFTSEFQSIQKKYPVHGRLRHIFDLAVALQLIADETPQRSERPLEMASDDSRRPVVEFPIQWVPSISAWRKTSNGRIAAVVSGGVVIDSKKVKLDRSTILGNIERKTALSLE